MLLSILTLLHVLISLVGIAAGLVAMAGLFRSNLSREWTGLFLFTTILTSLSGFLFPVARLLPSHIVGLISLVLLAVAVFALYREHLSGYWRPVYIVTAMLSLYLNVFVLIIQSFLKIPVLKALAPTQTEPAFVIVQGCTLLLFTALTVLLAIKFRTPGLAPLAR
jgi:hypothetical protein